MLRRLFSSQVSPKSVKLIEAELRVSAHNYHPLPVVVSRGQGVFLYDVDGKRYYDFLSAYSAVNQGHCHPKIVQALCQQASVLSLSSRAFYNDQLGRFAEYATRLFGYEMLLPMNTGAEGVETAVKVARRWGYRVKKIPMNRALIVSASGSFHGRTQTAMAMSSDPSMYTDFGPVLPGILRVEYDNLAQLESVLESRGREICGLVIEPIQGEAGVVVPTSGYLRKAFDLCKKHNVLFIADEIQTGIGRTGRMLAVDHEDIKPDLLILGKAISGGMYPVSLVLGARDILLQIRPGEHGSTFGGNPLACATSTAALEVIQEEKLCENAAVQGEVLRTKLSATQHRAPWLSAIRGKGLLNAVVIDHDMLRTMTGNGAWELCLLMMDRGLLAKPTHDNIIRLAPPLIIDSAQMQEAAEIIRASVIDIGRIPKDQIPNPEKSVKNPFPMH